MRQRTELSHEDLVAMIRSHLKDPEAEVQLKVRLENGKAKEILAEVKSSEKQVEGPPAESQVITVTGG